MEKEIEKQTEQQAKTETEKEKDEKQKKRLTIKQKIYLAKLKTKIVKLPDEIAIKKSASDLFVITKAKDLVMYIFLITKNSPIKFRTTFISRLQNLGLDLIENLYRANAVVVTKNDISNYGKRKELQNNALLNLKIMEYFALISYECECLTSKQYEQIAKQGSECKILLYNWMKSDKERLAK